MNDNVNVPSSDAHNHASEKEHNKKQPQHRNVTDQPELLIDTTAQTVKARFLQFLCGYGQEPVSTQNGVHPDTHTSVDAEELLTSTINYSQQAEVMRNTETSSLFVDFSHVLEYDSDLAQAIHAQYYRWEPYLRRAVFEFIRMEDAAYTISEDANKSQREFFVCFYNFQHVSHIRDLRMRNVGELVSFSGTVTRTTEVRPELLYAAFTCKECGGDTSGVEQQFKYTEPVKCQNPFCPNTSDWELNTEKSIFVDWQRVKVQENSDEIPAGSMPRSIDVILRHENVEQAKAGDRVVFTGSLIVVPDVSKFSKVGGDIAVAARSQGSANSTRGMEGEGVRGLKALGVRELTYKTCFLACSVQTMEQRFNSISIRNEDGDEDGFDPATDFTEHELNMIRQIKEDPDHYVKMAKSLCPSVYGHDEIRRGILLMLFGGVHKTTFEGINLRGDINICIVGDPSTAKSQFLKYICTFLPRAIYTSGKVSTAAGLTASVTRDADSGEYCVEAGALMLADNGICCIDEFDKMDTMDQVAIHEAMEQQTISITKAGIQATLNARTSILAAANPYNGRYDKTKTLKYNVNISAPIMSRFDLFFVVLDDCEETIDQRVAQHIVDTHMPPDLRRRNTSTTAYKEEDLKRYIKYARTLNPLITADAKQMMIACYRSLRENDVVSNGQSNIAYRITVRQLESMIRLSEALARMNLSEIVTVDHVEEAYRLLSKSIIHVDTRNVKLSVPRPGNKNNEDDDDMDVNGASEQQSPTEPPVASDQLNSSDIAPKHSMETDQSAPSQQDGSELSISFERYATIQKAIGRYIREKEEEDLIAESTKLSHKTSGEDEMSDVEAKDLDVGVLQGELVTWYLAAQDITSESQLSREKDMIMSVIDKLIQDKLLVLAHHDDGGSNDQQSFENEEERKQLRYLTVHPNLAL